MLLNSLAPLAGGLSQLAAAAAEEEELFGEEAAGLLSSLGATPFWPAWSSVWEMVLRLFINVVTIGIIVHAFYYPKAKRRDYYFTFSIIGVSIFLLIYLMGGVKLKIGFALGLFAIFGIIRTIYEEIVVIVNI